MPDLHDLHWETLHDPVDGTPMFVREDVLFSRYLISDDTRPVRLREREGPRALVVVGTPTNLAAFSMAPINVPAELERIEHGRGGVGVTFLNQTRPATLQNILAELQEAK